MVTIKATKDSEAGVMPTEQLPADMGKFNEELVKAGVMQAIEWVKRCPNPFPGGEAEIEIRQVFGAPDFGAELTPELREQEARMRTQIAGKA